MIWHVAFAVPDLDEGMEQFGTALGLDWLPVKHYRAETVDAQGKSFLLDTRLTFATGGPCAVELFQSVPGTPYAPADGTIFHHLGYWTENLASERSRLESCSWFHQGGPTDAESRAAFFAGPTGIFIEACRSTLARPGLDKYYPEIPAGPVT